MWFIFSSDKANSGENEASVRGRHAQHRDPAAGFTAGQQFSHQHKLDTSSNYASCFSSSAHFVQLSGLMLSEGLTDFRIRWRKVQSYRDDQSKEQDGGGDCKTEV